MRLINCETLQLQTFEDDCIPPYAILSHLWDSDGEVLFQDFTQMTPEELRTQRTKSYAKIKGFCQVVREHRDSLILPYSRIKYGWVDTCWYLHQILHESATHAR